MTDYVPIGVSDEVMYRLKALDKPALRWPALHLLAALYLGVVTYISVTRKSK